MTILTHVPLFRHLWLKFTNVICLANIMLLANIYVICLANIIYYKMI